MSMSISTTGRFLHGALAAAAVTVSLGAATLSTAEPAQARPFHHGFYHPHRFGGFHRFGYGYGFHHRGFGYRPFVHRYGYRPFHLIRAPFYGYGYRHCLRRVWGPYGWHVRRVC